MNNLKPNNNDVSTIATAIKEVAEKIAIIQRTVGVEHPELAEELIGELLSNFNLWD